MIPARGGSKGIPRKNVVPVGGRPLIAWTICAALSSRYLDRIVVSTEDQEIASTARDYGADVPFLRPATLATDSSPTVDALLHAVGALDDEFDIVVTLQPTSPLRGTALLDATVEHLVRTRAASCATIKRIKADASWLFTIGGAGGHRRLLPSADAVTRRQDASPLFVLDGSVYATFRHVLEATRSVVAEPLVLIENSEAAVDIDNPEDLVIAEALLSGRGDS